MTRESCLTTRLRRRVKHLLSRSASVGRASLSNGLNYYPAYRFVNQADPRTFAIRENREDTIRTRTNVRNQWIIPKLSLNIIMRFRIVEYYD